MISVLEKRNNFRAYAVFTVSAELESDYVKKKESPNGLSLSLFLYRILCQDLCLDFLFYLLLLLLQSFILSPAFSKPSSVSLLVSTFVSTSNSFVIIL